MRDLGIDEKGQPLLSVIVPVYNVAPYLRRCLDSICGQTYRSLEIICVDDGSTDESPRILSEYAAKDDRIQVISQANAGLSAARNTGLEHASGLYVTGVDSDDYIMPDTYEKAMTHMSAEVDVLQFGVSTREGGKLELSDSNPYFATRAEGSVEVNQGTIPLFVYNFWNKIYRMSVIREFSLKFPEGCWYEDLSFLYKYLSVVKNGYFLPERLYVYVRREDSIMGQTWKGTLRALDILKAVEDVYAFYTMRGIWEPFLPQVRYLAAHAYQTLMRSIGEQNKGIAERHWCQFVRKWQLFTYFPDDPLVKEALHGTIYRACRSVWRLSRGERITRGFVRLFYLDRPGKWRISFFGVPIVSKTRKEKEKVYRILGMKVRSKKL